MKIYTKNFTIILNRHITSKEIDTYEFRVLCYLLMLADDDGTCYPSYKTIAERIDISETKAKNSIKKLIDIGIIKKRNARKPTAVQLRICTWCARKLLLRLMRSQKILPFVCRMTYLVVCEKNKVVCQTTTTNTQI